MRRSSTTGFRRHCNLPAPLLSPWIYGNQH